MLIASELAVGITANADNPDKDMNLYSLKAKLIAAIVLISLMVGMVMLFALNTGTNRIISDLALRFGIKEALLEKNKVISIIDREVVLAQKMADDISIRRWAADENNSEARQQAFVALESYRKLFRDKSFFIALAASNHYYVYNKGKGHEQVETVTLNAARPDDKWFFEGLRTIDGYALNLDYNPTLHEAKVWFNAAMKGAKGEKIGICGGGISITDFLNEIVYTKNKGLSTILIDRSGVIQAHEDRSIVEHNANFREAEKKITVFNLLDDTSRHAQLREAITSLMAGKSEVQAFPATFGGKNFLLAISYMQEVGWFNVVLVDVSRIISMQEFLPIVAIMSAALLIAITMIGLLINRMVLAPITRLSNASRDVAAGRYDITLPVESNDEMADLTGSFNAMTATILDHTKNLETRVLERTDELSAANRLLEKSQQKITDSIGYARMIQTAILPSGETMERCLGEHCIMYRPKDMVGGDFYYLREFSGHFLLAVIDCTGHGIPGAFMTMTVNSVLNHVVDVLCCDNPARILSELNLVMRTTLHMRDVDAGLDIALCMIERNRKQLVYAGAGLNLYMTSAEGVREIRGNHQRIGYKGSKLDYMYTNHELDLSAGTCCYLTTDGLLDEPGGDKGYGFGSERFKAMLAEHANIAMNVRIQAFDRVLREYRGKQSQRDDITLLGFCSNGLVSEIPDTQ